MSLTAFGAAVLLAVFLWIFFSALLTILAYVLAAAGIVYFILKRQNS